MGFIQHYPLWKKERDKQHKRLPAFLSAKLPSPFHREGSNSGSPRIPRGETAYSSQPEGVLGKQHQQWGSPYGRFPSIPGCIIPQRACVRKADPRCQANERPCLHRRSCAKTACSILQLPVFLDVSHRLLHPMSVLTEEGGLSNTEMPGSLTESGSHQCGQLHCADPICKAQFSYTMGVIFHRFLSINLLWILAGVFCQMGETLLFGQRNGGASKC